MRSAPRPPVLVTATMALLFGVTACTSSGHVTAAAKTSASPSPTAEPSPVPTDTPSPTAVPTMAPTATPNPTPKPTTTPTTAPVAAGAPVAVPAGTGPVIVIDPGHSPSIAGIDPATGLNVMDYENEPEMTDVYAVAQLVQAKLTALGYRVVLTKTSLRQQVNLAQRAAIANSVHAALAISIHDQAGANGGIGFTAGNNIVYTQAVGDYRATPAGKKVIFTDATLAATSQRFGQIFQQKRAAIEGTSVKLQSNVGYDLGTRGLAAGNIWIVQLLSQVPWIYNEAGGNSAGRVGLSAADENTYASALAAGVEACVPA